MDKIERKKIGGCVQHTAKHVDISYHKQPPNSSDKVLSYSRNLLSIGCLYAEFQDAIRGDGRRDFRCSLEAFKLQHQYHYSLPPRQAEQLLWCRFANTHSVQGKNIPLDNQQEHLNRLCKNAIKSLGHKRQESAVVRCGKALGTASNMLSQFDKDSSVASASGAHSCPSQDKELVKIVSELQHEGVLTESPGRKYSCFPNPKNLLHASLSATSLHT